MLGGIQGHAPPGAPLYLGVYFTETVTERIFKFFLKVSFLKHFLFGSGFRFGSLQPIYINLIRDPLARLVSGYYFRRFGDYREGHRTWNFKGTDKEKNQVGLVWNISKLYLITLHNEWLCQKVMLPRVLWRFFRSEASADFCGGLRGRPASPR